MRKLEIQIDQALQEPGCTMINPGFRHPKDKDGFHTWEKIERNPINLVSLQDIISSRMLARYKGELLEMLDTKIPSLYVDCQQKGEDDILFFIFKEYIKQSKAEKKDAIVSDAIGSRTLITQDKKERNTYIQEQNPDIETMLAHYAQGLKALLQKNDDPEYKNSILTCERDIMFDGVAALMKAEDINHLYLYLDKTPTLSIDEQCRINELLYTRGLISNDKRIRLKINNGARGWKTRTCSSGHRVQSTHDYSETTIYEEDVQEYPSKE